MKVCLLFSFSFLFSVHLHAQNSVEQLSESKVDSLRTEHVDSILWYRSYCGACFFRKTDAPIKYYGCQVQSGYDLSYNAIIYKQQGHYFILNFDCNNLVIKKQLDTCKSISYSISIIPTLNKRDKEIIELSKRDDKYFLGELQMDGTFAEVNIYYDKVKQHIRMPSSEYEDKYKKYFWIPKQIQLIKLISEDISVRK